MNEIKKATHLTRDHYGFYKFWPQLPEGILKDEHGEYVKDEKDNNVSGVHNNVDITDLGLTCDSVNLAPVIGDMVYDIFRDANTHEVVTEVNGVDVPAAVIKAVVRYEAKFGVKERVNKRK